MVCLPDNHKMGPPACHSPQNRPSIYSPPPPNGSDEFVLSEARAFLTSPAWGTGLAEVEDTS